MRCGVCIPKRMLALGVTQGELARFIATGPTEADWYAAVLTVIRQDRRGVFAAQKEARSAQRKRWLSANPTQRIRNSVSARMWAALKGRTDGALFSRLGYSADDLVAHIERQFLPGMSWGNYGKWHIDHLKPCAAFDLTDIDQFAECWGLPNLQPLWATDNIKKGAKHGAS